jgi:alpha,alpha-trehalase
VAEAASAGLAVVDAHDLYEQIMKFDYTGDGKLTNRDAKLAHEAGVTFAVQVQLARGAVTLWGPERMGHAAQVAARAIQAQTPIREAELLESPGVALAHNVSAAWPAFVRRSNNIPDLVKALESSNLPAPDGRLHVWVPAADADAVDQLSREAVKYNLANPDKKEVVIELFTPGMDWSQLDQHKPGILYLPEPFVVPGGRFDEMYGWDSYRINQGLLASGEVDLARSMIKNQVYLLDYYGKIPNSTRSYHLSRPQSPYLPRMALELYEADQSEETLEVLKDVARAAEIELKDVWKVPSHKQPAKLARFFDDASGPDPEVERNLVANGVFTWPNFAADRAARASGWDLSHRYTDHAHLIEPVDLNSDLYRYQKDLAAIYRIIEGEHSARAAQLDEAADNLGELIRDKCWNGKIFVDFDTHPDVNDRSTYESAAALAPLQSGVATQEQADEVVRNLVPRLLERGGLATSTRASRESAGEEALQWDWPNGWAPLQQMAVEGLHRYGYDELADEVAYRWCAALIEIAGSNNGLLPEKIDVHTVSADVAAAEYGNQGADRGAYWTAREDNPQGFGWTNASFLKLRAGLPEHLRVALDRGVPAERFFPTRG